MKFFRMASVISIVTVFVLSLPASAQEKLAPRNGLRMSPPEIYANYPCSVSFFVDLPLSDNKMLSPSKVILYRIDDQGMRILLDQLEPLNRFGDMFSTKLIFREKKPQIVKLQLSAEYGGQTKDSEIFQLKVHPDPKFEDLWASFVSEMSRKNLFGALGYFKLSRRLEYMASYNKVGIEKVSEAFKTARDLSCKIIWVKEAECSFNITMGSKECIGIMNLELGIIGEWQIDDLGFIEKRDPK